MTEAGGPSRQGSQASIASGASGGPGHGGAVNPLAAYLRTITDWHAKSAEIVDFVTNPVTTSQPSPAARRSFSSDASTKPEPASIPTPTPTTTPTTRRPLPSHPTKPKTPTTTTTTTENNNNNPPPHKPTLPIALLPAGFSLTLSDRFACAVPIADAYAPVDHWQWMATLWRGIVGPDLVIYAAPAAPAPARAAASASACHGGAAAGSVGGGGGGGGTVEVRSAGLVVVRLPAPAPASGEGDGAAGEVAVVDEKVQRRLGFEIVEWVRSAGWVDSERGRVDEGHGAMEY
ncbi:uncharacterized protein THITE_2123234 [Thermothielavioides terrestris NRRL 8126]|uniref:Uncharacterized protein n=3 Tax=Thermothielavioides terrestris TaxID=2587410 RepID=G2RH12_THETT|nr:uncharacterized protein THITE_2123234 [Thermothielavioides terrestris NRRL 8126]AEO71141.1 hypothetical protein THITE_2123234 [Thermothielavioides terrestris NRRL 8126]